MTMRSDNMPRPFAPDHSPGGDFDIMLDVYMTSTQRGAFERIAARLAAAEAERDVLKECNENQAQGFKQISDAIGCDDTMETGTIDRLVNLVAALAALRERVRGVQRWRVSAKPPTLSGLTRADDGNVMLAADVDAAVGGPAPVEDGDVR
jgi:hypothetical protein